MTAKEKVLAVWPDAWMSETGHIWPYRLFTEEYKDSKPLGIGWEAAALRMTKGHLELSKPEPVAPVEAKEKNRLTYEETKERFGLPVAEPKPSPSTHEESAMWIVGVKAANEAYLKQFEDELPSERTYGVNRISVWRLPQHASLIDLIDRTQSCTSGLSVSECLAEIKRRLGE